MGRGFRAEEEAQATPVAVVSHGFWERSLGSRSRGRRQDADAQPDAVHDRRRRAEELHRRAARRRAVGLAADVAQRRRRSPNGTRQRRGLFLFSVARLKPGVTAEQARAEPQDRLRQPRAGVPGGQQGTERHGGAAPPGAAESQRPGGERPGPAVHRPDDRRRDRAADRLRQHRQSAAVARDEAAPRGRRSGWRSARSDRGWCGSCSRKA